MPVEVELTTYNLPGLVLSKPYNVRSGVPPVDATRTHLPVESIPIEVAPMTDYKGDPATAFNTSPLPMLYPVIVLSA